MPRLLHYFLSDPVGYSDYGPCHHLGFLKLNLSVKPRLAANLCSSHLSLPSGGITVILSHCFNQTPDGDCLPKVMQDCEQCADVSSLPWAFLSVRLKSCQVCSALHLYTGWRVSCHCEGKTCFGWSPRTGSETPKVRGEWVQPAGVQAEGAARNPNSHG